jgi:hypothetical protein
MAKLQKKAPSKTSLKVSNKKTNKLNKQKQRMKKAGKGGTGEKTNEKNVVGLKKALKVTKNLSNHQPFQALDNLNGIKRHPNRILTKSSRLASRSCAIILSSRPISTRIQSFQEGIIFK